MLLTIAIILFVLWLLGLTVIHLGGLLHIILVLAIIVLVWHLLTGNRRV